MQIAADRLHQPSSAIVKLMLGFSRRGRRLLVRMLPIRVSTHLARRSPAFMGAAAELARSLISTRGEASGVAIAQELLRLYAGASQDERRNFFAILAENFDPNPSDLLSAWADYQGGGRGVLQRLARAVESPRQELFRRLNLAPGATGMLVQMRADLLSCAKASGRELDGVEADLSHLLQSWFNRGFLAMRPINWHSPASLLERIIRYEAVHDIEGWDDLRRRLDPGDRRCFGFFHPAMLDEPLIFVEVALTSSIPGSIQDVLAADREPLEATSANTAVFYSISNCFGGLRGISLGHFLIKQVVDDLKLELPGLRRFATLSPMPGFMPWLAQNDEATFATTQIDRWWEVDEFRSIRAGLMARGVDYLADAKSADGRPIDPVARFHLGNGARLERLNWLGDMSPKGLRQSAGVMVNYTYDLSKIEERHESYSSAGVVIVSPAFERAARQLGRSPQVKVA
jgi:malonyl-CoA decarboxylase